MQGGSSKEELFKKRNVWCKADAVQKRDRKGNPGLARWVGHQSYPSSHSCPLSKAKEIDILTPPSAYLILVTTVTTGGASLFKPAYLFPQRTQNGLLLGKFIQRLKTQIYNFFVMKIWDAPSQILNVINTTSQRHRHQLLQKIWI